MAVAQAERVLKEARRKPAVAPPEGRSQAIELPEPKLVRLEARIRGLTPLIVHKFADEEMEKIENKQQGGAKGTRPPRSPQTEYEAARYLLPDGRHAFPAIGLKLAMANAGYRFCDEKNTVTIKGAISIPADLLEIEPGEGATIRPTVNGKAKEGDWPIMRSDRVVLKGGVASIAYRPAYFPWEMTVPIVFDADFFTTDRVLNFLVKAGSSVGIGDWRVEKDGTFGQFQLVSARRIEYGGR